MLYQKVAGLLTTEFSDNVLIFCPHTGQTHRLDIIVIDILNLFSSNNRLPFQEIADSLIGSLTDSNTEMAISFLNKTLKQLLETEILIRCDR